MNYKTVKRLSSLSILSIAITLSAQSAITPHNHNNQAVVRGAQNPDAIPDFTAYRLILITLSSSESPSNEEVRRQSAVLSRMPLNTVDKQALLPIIAVFHAQYKNWMVRFNDLATTAQRNGVNFNPQELFAERDQIVQSAISSLQISLSPHGWAGFDAHVKGEKRHMIIAAPAGAQ